MWKGHTALALGEPRAQTTWNVAQPQNNILFFFPIGSLGPCAMETLRYVLPLGPLWGLSGALRAPRAVDNGFLHIKKSRVDLYGKKILTFKVKEP